MKKLITAVVSLGLMIGTASAGTDVDADRKAFVGHFKSKKKKKDNIITEAKDPRKNTQNKIPNQLKSRRIKKYNTTKI